MQIKHSIYQLVKDTTTVFEYFRANMFYYSIKVEDTTYTFPVPLEDIGTATLLKEDKAIVYMRWIRKAIENELMQFKSED